MAEEKTPGWHNVLMGPSSEPERGPKFSQAQQYFTERRPHFTIRKDGAGDKILCEMGDTDHGELYHPIFTSVQDLGDFGCVTRKLDRIGQILSPLFANREPTDHRLRVFDPLTRTHSLGIGLYFATLRNLCAVFFVAGLLNTPARRRSVVRRRAAGWWGRRAWRAESGSGADDTRATHASREPWISAPTPQHDVDRDLSPRADGA